MGDVGQEEGCLTGKNAGWPLENFGQEESYGQLSG